MFKIYTKNNCGWCERAKKILEEHVLQHGQFSLLMGEYAKLKNGKNYLKIIRI